MFAIPGLIVLVALIYIRPQEFIEPLQAVPLLYLCFFLCVFGMALDLRLRSTRVVVSPQLPWVALFCLWALVSALLHAPRQLAQHALVLGIPVALYLILAHGIQSLKALHVVGGVVLAVALFVAAVGVHQGFAETGCVLVDETVIGDQATGKFDGRPCTTATECYQGDAEPGGQYLCERIGLFGTTSISKGRIRYRGVLQDPNELALAAGIGLPLVFAATRRRGSLARSAFGVLTLLLVLVCAILSRSRGGQVVILAVLGVYFVKRFGLRGLLAGGLFGLPLLLLGGRQGSEAEVSTNERLECWYEALGLFREHPLLGVGFGQFGEYHYLTAHNSFMLTLAELGAPGMVLFTIVVYLSIKIPFTALRRYPNRGAQGAGLPVDPMAQVWALALLAALIGLALGMFFLSFAYHDPEFVVKFGWRDLVGVGVIDAAIIGVVYILTRTMLS
jgi:hypothetical protein